MGDGFAHRVQHLAIPAKHHNNISSAFGMLAILGGQAFQPELGFCMGRGDEMKFHLYPFLAGNTRLS